VPNSTNILCFTQFFYTSSQRTAYPFPNNIQISVYREGHLLPLEKKSAKKNEKAKAVAEIPVKNELVHF